MPANRRALEFIELCASLKDVAEIERHLYAVLAQFGYAYVACSSHVDPLKPGPLAVSMCNYPLPWQQHYSQNNYAHIDAVFCRARSSALPFDWTELAGKLSREQRRMFDEAAEFGIRGGETLPLNVPNAIASSCSLVPGPERVDPHIRPAVHMVALYAFETALARMLGDRRPKTPLLPPRERQVVTLIGMNKGDEVIAEILGISVDTVRTYIKRAKDRYGVAGRTSLVIKALFDGQIRLDELER